MKLIRNITLAALSIIAISCDKAQQIEGGRNQELRDMIHSSIIAGTPSNQSPVTKVVLDGDAPSEPIQVMWAGSTISFQEKFALIEYDDGMLSKYPATRSIEEVQAAMIGNFDFDIPGYGKYYALYPYKDYDSIYMSGNDMDMQNWVYRLDGQSGKFEDLHNYEFMTGTEAVSITSDNIEPIQFQHEIAILRLSSLTISGLSNTTISGITLKSDAIADAASYRCSFSPYNGVSTDITLSGEFLVGDDGRISENIYVAFFPSGKTATYFDLELIISGNKYKYSYNGSIKTFEKGKVYTLKNATMTLRQSKASYGWYTNPVANNSYELTTVNDFLGFANIVNGDSHALAIVGLSEADNFTGKTVSINSSCDFDLSDVLETGDSWIPINNFQGTFLGNGITISNLYNDQLIESDYGLFGQITNAVIDGVSITGIILGNASFNQIIGGLVGRSNQSSIINCGSRVNMNLGKSEGRRIGGLCGSMVDGSFMIGCKGNSEINVSTANNDADYCGGLVGYCSNAKVIACIFEGGTIKSNNYSSVSGIVGYSSGCTIQACYSNCTLKGYNPGFITSSFYTSNPGTIDGCFYNGSGASAGIGTRNGNAYEWNTAKANDKESAVSSMNASISTWNTNNPQNICNKEYSVVSNEIKLN